MVGDSELAFFGEYGLIPEEDIPGRPDVQYVADHIRVCLDCLEQGDFEFVRGMNREILGGGWRDEVFERVLEMRVAPHWNEIDAFMHEEYGVAWTAGNACNILRFRIWICGRSFGKATQKSRKLT